MISRKTCAVMPVYNEATVVEDVIKDAKRKFANIVCVDDGSHDESVKKILRTGVTLVQHPINLGAGAATQTGIDYGLQDPAVEYFVTLDADGQHSVEDACRMLEYLQEHKLDIVFGSRFIGTVENISRLKKLFLKLAAVFSKSTTNVALTDPHIGLRVFNRRFAENLKLSLPDFTHASELVHRVGEGGYKYAEIPVTITYSDYSKSKGQPMLNSINIVIDLLFHRISK